jgi:DNA-binding transcriptional LysR family regulator
LNLRFVETFVWVARLKSFSLTAEKLHTTQAAVSQRIATLERELGVKLFERDTREISLTSHGIDALVQAERLMHMATEFKRRVSDPKSLAGTVRIGVMETVAYSWLPMFIERLNAEFPEVVLELDAYTSADIADFVQKNRLDMGLLMSPVTGAGIVNVELCTFATLWAASPKIALPPGRLDIEQIVHLPIISYPRNSVPHATMVSYFRRPGCDHARLHCVPLGTMVRLLLEGMGVAAVPSVAIERELAQGSLRTLDIRPAFPPIPVYAAYTEAQARPLLPLLADMAREVARDFCRPRDPQLAWAPAASQL